MEIYRICNFCIMDTSDCNIRFDENGNCNHCRNYLRMADDENNMVKDKDAYLKKLVSEIKKDSHKRKYDCLTGVSGGADSSYVVYLMKEYKLRPLAMHLDNGWNSELAVENIKNILKALDIDLFTVVLDWNSFRDLQLAFLYASVPDAEVPTDHAIFAAKYSVARKYGIKYIISGENMSTEGILPRSWTYGVHDWRYIKGIHDIYGKTKLINYPHYNIFQQNYYNKFIGIKYLRILNYIDYKKEDAINILKSKVGWRNYIAKHFESVYTRFFQGYILPGKFGIDKRRAHLSTLICSNQLTRSEALEEIKINKYTPEMQNDDREYVLKKLKLDNSEFEKIMNLPKQSYKNYKNYVHTVNLIKKVLKTLRFKIREFDR